MSQIQGGQFRGKERSCLGENHAEVYRYCAFLLWGQVLLARYWISNTKSRPKMAKRTFRYSQSGDSLWARHQIELIWFGAKGIESLSSLFLLPQQLILTFINLLDFRNTSILNIDQAMQLTYQEKHLPWLSITHKTLGDLCYTLVLQPLGKVFCLPRFWSRSSATVTTSDVLKQRHFELPSNSSVSSSDIL